MSDTLSCIIKDIRAVLVYYPLAVLIGFVITMLFVMIYKKRNRKPGRARTITAFLFFTYVVMLLNITYFSREPGSRTGIDLTFFGTWGQWPQSKAYFLENILLFVPFGCCLPIVWKRTKNLFVMFFAAAVLSCGIELAQYLNRRGFSQLDDVVTNVAGALAGWMIYMIFALFRWTFRRIRKCAVGD